MIEGFFTKKEVESITRPGGKAGTCVTCGLHRTCTTPQMKPFGNFKKKILNIGEAPGEVEDKVGRPWQGKVGKLLQRTYASLGVDLFGTRRRVLFTTRHWFPIGMIYTITILNFLTKR